MDRRGEPPNGYQEVGYPRLRELLERDAQLVEVLPAEEYEELHLPGAVNIPLKQLNEDSASALNRSRPIVLYCWDSL